MTEEKEKDEALTVEEAEAAQPALTLESFEVLEKALNEEREKSAEHWNRLLHKESELQNFARRARQELDAAKKYGADSLASDLVVVLDSLDHGVQAAPNDEGLVLVQKNMLDILKKYGITMLNPHEESFNPQFHEAIATQPSKEVPPNTILVVAQKGYMLHDRLLRPARVVVSCADTSDAP